VCDPLINETPKAPCLAVESGLKAAGLGKWKNQATNDRGIHSTVRAPSAPIPPLTDSSEFF